MVITVHNIIGEFVLFSSENVTRLLKDVFEQVTFRAMHNGWGLWSPQQRFMCQCMRVVLYLLQYVHVLGITKGFSVQWRFVNGKIPYSKQVTSLCKPDSVR